MKVLVYCDDPAMGGVGHHCLTVLRAARHQGWDVHLAQPRCRHVLLDQAVADGVVLWEIGYDTAREFRRTLTDAVEPARILDAARPDLVVFADCCQVSNLAAKHAAITRGLPFIVVCHSAATYLAARFSSCLGLVRRQFALAAEVVAVSHATLAVTRTHYGLDARRGVVVSSGRPAVFFAPRSSEQRARVRAELGIAEDAIVCLTTARITAEKGFGLLLEAIRQLRDAGRLGKLQFVWAGDGPLLPALRREIADHRLSGVIHCLGRRDQVEHLYDAADLFALPTFHEAFGLSIVEAMAKRLAVIASQVEAVPEVLGDAGVYVPDPKADPAAVIARLQNWLVQLAGAPSLVAEWGARAHARAAQFFTESRMEAGFAAVMARVGQRSGSGAAALELTTANSGR